MNLAAHALARLRQHDAIWITVDATQGSVPRDTGTWMAVFADAAVGTIGGGRVEFEAIAEAHRRLAGASGLPLLRYPLGPGLGQCCGGVMHLRFEPVQCADVPALRARLARQHMAVALFGGGHVGRALVDVLGRLPCTLTWIDSRDEIFPAQLPDNVVCEHSDPVHHAVAGLTPLSHVLVMSFSHAEDLDVVAQCLRRQRVDGDLRHIGLIGSATKWATFRHRLQERGFSDAELGQVTCPIGLPEIPGKEPEVIAVSVAAQLLQHRGA